MKQWVLLLLCATTCISASCLKLPILPEYSDISSQIKYNMLKFPPANFDNVIWRTNGVLVAIQDENTGPLRQTYALEGDNMLRHLDLVQDRNCAITHYRFPTQLPDERLGLIKWCVTDNAFTYASYMVAYDWDSGQLEQIVQNPLKHFDLAQCFSWNPEMTKGVQLVGEGLTGDLNWLTRTGPEPVHITLRDGNRVWDLAKDYEENGSIAGGRISCPSWSPKGDKIAVFVSFDAMGVEGISRIDKQAQLLLLSPETGESESVLSEIYYPMSTNGLPTKEALPSLANLRMA